LHKTVFSNFRTRRLQSGEEQQLPKSKTFQLKKRTRARAKNKGRFYRLKIIFFVLLPFSITSDLDLGILQVKFA